MDISKIDSNVELQNILSIGNDIKNWAAPTDDKFNLHMYYNKENEEPKIYVAIVLEKGWQYQFTYTLPKNTKTIKIAFDNRGLYVNGELILSKEGASDKTVYLKGSDSNIGSFFKNNCYK